jgi:calcineurin-like phosphoesterase family protein
MDAEIIRRWNESVTERDLVYVLGDVGRGANVRCVSRLVGRKHLIAGNGDNLPRLAGLGLFESIVVAKRLPGVLLTHIPVHPSQLQRGKLNVHGHLHGMRVADARYVCVSVEQTDFAPMLLAQIVTSARP